VTETSARDPLRSAEGRAPAHDLLRARRATSLVGLVAAYYVIAIVLFERWNSRHWYRPTGDEPHYLTVAWSLAYYHSPEVSRAYAHEFTAQTFPGLLPGRASLTPLGMHGISGPHGLFSEHGLGLPSLLIPGLRLGGVDGAKLTMIMISGIAVGIIGYVALFRIQSIPRAMATASVVAIGMPLLPASAQIYPDIPAGVVALAVVGYVYISEHRHSETQSLSRTRLGGLRSLVFALVVVMVAYEPWLHVKELVPALIGAAGLVWVARRRGQTRMATFTLLAVGLSLVGLVAYNLYAFGSVLPGYTSGNSVTGFSHSLMVFLGLHLDSVQGIFVQAPILVLGLAGLVRGCLRHQVWAYVAAATYVAVMLPNATFSNTYGGLSFAGRFGWTAALILFVPAVDLLADLWDRHRVLVVTGLIAEALLEIMAFTRYGLDHYVLYSQLGQGQRVAWAKGYPTVWGRLGQLLPSYDSPWVWRYLPDVLAPVLVVCAVIALLTEARGTARRSPGGVDRRAPLHRRAARLRDGRSRVWMARAALAATATGYLLAAVLAPVPQPPIQLRGADLPHTEGQVVADAILVTAPPDHVGYVTFGPPFFLTAGTYTVTFVVRTRAVEAGATVSANDAGGPDPSLNSALAAWDVDINPGGRASVTEPDVVVARGPLPSTDGRIESVTGRFTLPHAASTWAVQTRTILLRPATLSIESITLRPCCATGPEVRRRAEE